MAEGINPTLDGKAQAEENLPVYLYEITLAGTVWHLAANVTNDIEFGGETWQAASISKGDTESSIDPTIEEVPIEIQNITREFSAYVANNPQQVNGQRVRILKTFMDLLDDPASVMVEFEGEIDGMSVNAEAASFTVRRYQSALSLTLPRRKYEALCQYEFKGAGCGYTGTATSCDHTMARCKGLANRPNFGGFLGVPKEDPV